MDTKNNQSLMCELKEKLLDVGSGFMASIQQSKENISRYQKRTHPGFEILGPANQDYYQFAFFERHLEGEIRDNLVYPFLEVVFALFGMPLHKVLRDNKVLEGFRNDGYEKHQHLEFWFEDSQGVNGCRYTEVDEQDEDFIDFIGKLHINHIYVINWKDKRKIIENQMITEIDVRSFLDGYFGEDISATIVEAMRLYVNAANRIMGFQTIKDYSMQNIYEFKSVIKRTFYSLPYTDLKYIALNHQGREESYIIGENDKKHIDTFFRNNKLHEAFFGRKGFSKCFLTSEYLFGIFKEGQCFDYTSVVCGYMKALEQLIYEILLVEVNKNPSRNIYIKFNNRIPKEEKEKINEYFDYIGKNKVPHIAFLPQLKDYFDISMKPMINLLEHHRDIWRLSFNGQKAICEMLSDFCNACRNDHFHKDNILEYSDVVAIRNNTIMLFYLLLGSCKLGEKEELYEALGVQLGSFSEFYSELGRIPRSQSWFILEFKSERINAMRMFNQPNTKYDKEDGMENSIVLFTKVEEFQNENDNSWLSMEGDKNTIVVTKDYFPDKVWLVVRGTNENRLVFSRE